MKKTTYRILSVIFVLVITCAFATPVFAADSTTVSWNDGESLYQMAITLTGSHIKQVPFSSASSVTWAGVGSMNIPYVRGWTAVCQATYATSLNNYSNYLSTGLVRLGAHLSLVGTAAYGGEFTLDSEMETGSYTSGLDFYCRSGRVELTQSAVGILTLSEPQSSLSLIGGAATGYGNPVLIGPY